MIIRWNEEKIYCDSAIGQHFLENKEFAKHYNQYLNCKILHGGDAFAALTKRIRNANEI